MIQETSFGWWRRVGRFLMNRLVAVSLVSLALCAPFGVARAAQLETTVARLWIHASDGAVRNRDRVQPAKDSLIALGVEAVPYLLPFLHTEDARERHTITDLFKGIGSPAVPSLVAVLGDGERYHTTNTLNALGKIGDSAATVAVVPFLRADLYAIRAQAAETIGKCGGAPAEGALFGVLADTVETVRKSAVVGLGRLARASSADTLTAALVDEWYGVRYAAALALVRIDSGAVALKRLRRLKARPLALVLHALADTDYPIRVAPVWSLATDDDNTVRAAAARLLAKFVTDKRGQSRLDHLLANESEPIVRYHFSRGTADRPR